MTVRVTKLKEAKLTVKEAKESVDRALKSSAHLKSLVHVSSPEWEHIDKLQDKLLGMWRQLENIELKRGG